MTAEVEVMDQILNLLKMIWPLIVLQYALTIWAIIDLVRRPNVRHLPKLAWGAIILLVNFFGPIAYLVLGREE